MKCYDGVMSTDHAKFGVLSTSLDKQTYCRSEAVFKNPSNKDFLNCTKYVNPADQSKIDSQIKACNGKADCTIDISNL